jgi:hypothetical protein
MSADSEAIGTSRAYRAPHVMLRVAPEVRDGAWEMRFGGVVGRGSTPALAAAAFDNAWFNHEVDQ